MGNQDERRTRREADRRAEVHPKIASRGIGKHDRQVSAISFVSHWSWTELFKQLCNPLHDNGCYIWSLRRSFTRWLCLWSLAQTHLHIDISYGSPADRYFDFLSFSSFSLPHDAPILASRVFASMLGCVLLQMSPKIILTSYQSLNSCTNISKGFSIWSLTWLKVAECLYIWLMCTYWRFRFLQ